MVVSRVVFDIYGCVARLSCLLVVQMHFIAKPLQPVLLPGGLSIGGLARLFLGGLQSLKKPMVVLETY